MFKLVVATIDTNLADRVAKAPDGLASVLRNDPNPQSLREIITRAKADLIIVDVEPVDGAAVDLAGIAQAVRDVGADQIIIAIGDETVAASVLLAVRAGVRDFISQDCDVEKLRSLIGGHLGQTPRRNTVDGGHLTCVVGDDGAAGGAFFATNYAVLRASLGRDVILIDCTLPSTEADASLDLTFNYTVRHAIQDLSRIDRTLLSSTLARHASSGLHVLPLALGAEDIGDLTPSAILSMLLVMRGLFSEVIINIGGIRHPGILTELLQSATDTYVVVTQKFTSLKSCKELLRKLAPGEDALQRMTLLIDDYHDEITLTEQQMVAAIGLQRSARLPAARAALVNALNRGKPLVLEERRHPYVRAISRLAGVVKELPPEAPPKIQQVRKIFARLVPSAT